MAFFFDMGDCMMFTSKLVLCQYCKLFFKAMYAHEILAFTGFLAGVRNRSTTCFEASFITIFFPAGMRVA
jgi:hypothetical protein